MVAHSAAGSSYASSTRSSSVSSALKRARANQDNQDGHGEHLVGRRSTIENGIFGVLFTLSKENSETRIRIRWVLVKILLDAWQLFTTVINPATQGWRINANGTAWKVISVLNFTWLGDLGYGAYLAVLYCMLALLAVNVVMCVWVAWCFKEHKFPVVWPIKVLRVFSSVFFQAFDVASLNLLQLGISCHYSGPVEPHLRFSLFPSYSCTSPPHVMHAVVSALCLVLFVAIGLLLNMSEVEVNPLSRRPLALGHSGAEVMAFAIKVLLTLVDVFIGWRRVAACLYLALSVALAWQCIRWSPNLVAWVNYMKAGVSVTIVWCSVMLVALVFRPAVEAGRSDKWASGLTVLMLAGLMPAFGVGAAMSWTMIRRMTETALKALAEAEAEVKLEDICENLDSPRDVEVVARCCRVWKARYTLDAEAVNKAHQVIKAGVAMFPKSAYMVLLHANFMIEVLGVSQSGSRRIQDARKLNPGIMCRFIMFVRQQQASQRAAGSTTNDGAHMDLLGYVEYQRKQRMVVRLHREALQAMCGFWKALDSSSVSFTHLSKALGKIESSVSQAHTAYRVVLESYGNNPSLVRLYGRFLLTIKNDPWSASEYLTEADRLEEIKNGDASGPLLPDGTPLGRMDELSIAVLVTNATGEVQMANRQTHVCFGYKRGTLEGKPLSALLAPHCNRWLTTELAKLVTESGSAAATTDSEGSHNHYESVVVGMHCERLAFPVRLSLNKASGVGEDSTIIALMEPIPPVKGMSSLWVTANGTVAACDPQFASMFGWGAAEVNGASILTFLTLQETHEGTDAGAQRGQSGSGIMKRLKSLAKGAAGREQTTPCAMVHKYDNVPVACTVRLSTKEAEDTPVHEVRIRLVDPDPPQLLVVTNKGAVVHASPELAGCLKDALGAVGKQRLGARGEGAGGRAPVGGVLASTDALAGYTFFDFLPPPWREMHTKFLRDTTLASAPTRLQWSCRKGSPPGPTLELRSATGKPLYMHVSVATTDLAGELTHVVRLARSSLEGALAERRLRLRLTDEGLVTGVTSGAPHLLFGLDEGKIIGRGLWELVQELGNPQSDRPTAPGPQAFRSLVNRSVDLPGHSWRVHVMLPPRPNAGAPSSLTLAARVSAAKTAVLQVHLEAPQDDAAPDTACQLFVDLWPINNLTGVLELDGSGRISAVLEEGVRPAGLLFGLPSAALVGTALEELVALPPGRTSPGDLLSLHGAKKSSLKVKKKEAHVKVGPVHILMATHSDGRPLALEVQVVGKPGPNQPLTAIIRPHKAPMLPAPTAAGTVEAPRLANAPSLPLGMDPPVRSMSAISMVTPAKGLAMAAVRVSKLLEPEHAFSPGRASQKGLTPLPPRCEPAGDTPPSTVSPRHTGYSNAHTISGDVQIVSTIVPTPLDLLSSTGAGGGLPLPGVTAGKAAALAGRSKLADLVKSVGGEGRASQQLPEENEQLVKMGTGLLTASKPDGALQFSQHLGEPSLPGSATNLRSTLQGAAKKSSRTAIKAEVADSDVVSDGGSEARGLQRKASRISEGTERVAAWVTSKGSFYQNSVRPAGAKMDEDDEMSRRSDDLELGLSLLRPVSGGRAGAAADRRMSPGRTKGSPPASSRPEGRIGPYTDDDAASEGGQSAVSGISGVSDEAGGAEYKRGKRFRKLARMMDSSVAQEVSQRFRRHAMGVVALLALVHVVCFCIAIDAIQSQKASMMQLGRSDESQRFMHRVLTDVRSLDVISRNKTAPKLYTAANTTFFLNRIAADAEEIKVRLNGMLKAHHASKSAVMDVFYYTHWKVWDRNADDGSDLWVNLTVWDFGTQFYNYAKDVVETYDLWQSENVSVESTAPGQFLLKSGPDLWRASRKALDALLFVAVGDTRWVDTLQLIFLAIEGAFLSCLAACYVAYLLRAVAAQRFKLYSTFLVIPVGLTRALASQNTALLVDDDEDDTEIDDEKPSGNDQEEEHEDEGANAKAKRRATLKISDTDAISTAAESPGPSRGLRRLPSRNGNPMLSTGFGGKGGQSMKLPPDGKEENFRGPLGFLRALSRGIRRTLRRGTGVNPLPFSFSGGATSSAGAAGKRNLRYDSHETAMMIMPFLLWSVLVIAFYATAVLKMKDVAEVVAIHAVANFMAARTYRTVFFTQELAVVEDPSLLPSRRAALATCTKIVTDAYYTLQLGEKAYMSAGANTERFPMVTSGLAFASEELADVFYASGRCHRQPEHLPCPGPGYRFYQSIYTGVDSMMREFLQKVSTLASNDTMNPPGLTDDNVDWIYNVGGVDLSDGIVEIEQLHYDSIKALFTRIMLLHIILFLLMWIVIAGFLFVLLNPVLKRVSRERKHIAELMSQLPLELDVEKLVARALGTLTGPATGQASGNAQDGTMGGNTDGHDSDSGADATNKWKAIIRSASNAVAKQASGSLNVK